MAPCDMAYAAHLTSCAVYSEGTLFTRRVFPFIFHYYYSEAGVVVLSVSVNKKSGYFERHQHFFPSNISIQSVYVGLLLIMTDLLQLRSNAKHVNLSHSLYNSCKNMDLKVTLDWQKWKYFDWFIRVKEKFGDSRAAFRKWDLISISKTEILLEHIVWSLII